MKNFRVKVDNQCCHGQTHYPAATLLTQCDFSSCSLQLDTCQQLLFFKSYLACVTMAVTQGEKSFKYTSTGWLWLRCVMLTPNRTWWCVWLPQNKYKIKICTYLLCFTFMCWFQIDFFPDSYVFFVILFDRKEISWYLGWEQETNWCPTQAERQSQT